MKISIITFILILTFCATGFSQSAFSLELKYQPTIRTYEWNKLEKHPFSDEIYYPNRGVLLINSRIGKKERHYIKTGFIIEKIKIKLSEGEYIHPQTMQTVYTDGALNFYSYSIPLYYNLLIKSFYIEAGGQLKSEYAFTTTHFGNELVATSFASDLSIFRFEYHFGFGYQKMFGRIGTKVGVTLNAPINLNIPYYDYGVNLGLLYQFK